MKKIKKSCFLIIPLLVSLLWIITSASSTITPDQGWVWLHNLSRSNSPQVTPLASSNAHMEVNVTVPGFDFSTVEHHYRTFHRIKLTGQSNNLELGTPNVPMLRELISVPEGAVLSIRVLDVQYKTFHAIDLEPVQRTLNEHETDADREFRMDDVIYETDQFYPANWVDSTEFGQHREVNMRALEIHPIRYNPVTKEVQAAYSITFSVDFEGQAMFGVPVIPEHLEETYKGMLLNYDFMNFQVGSPYRAFEAGQVPTDYLIIAAKELVNSPSLQQLVQYHEGRGRKCEILDVSTLGTTPEEIRAAILQVYRQASPAELDYLLFVGDTDTIPLKTNVYSDERQNYRSDIWYGFLAGNDMLADVGMGRFPARNEAELANMVKKTLDFHTNAHPGPWQNRALFVAHQENYPYKYTECKESIYTHTFKLPTPEFIRMYGGDSSKKWTNDDVNREIDKGVLVVNYRGHGQKTQWEPWSVGSWRVYSADDFKKVKNGTKTPVIFNVACHNGDIGYNGESLVETMIRHPNGGAVAALGALNTSSTSPNHDFDRALFFGTWDLGINSIGNLLNYSIAEMMKIHGMDRNVVIYLWVGDPALSILEANGSGKMLLNKQVKGEGTIVSNPSGEVYNKGTVVTVTAKAGPGWEFTKWADDLSGTSPTAAITMDSHKTVTAYFTQVALVPPTNITTKSFSTDKMILNWTAVEGATSYIVYKADQAAGPYTEAATVAGTSADVFGLQPQTTYYFKVKSKSEVLISDLSPPVSGTTSDAASSRELENGVGATSSVSAVGNSEMWVIYVKPGAQAMRTVVECPGSDYDIYGKFEQEPTKTNYDWKGSTTGGDEVDFQNPRAGKWYIMVRSYQGTGNYTLKSTVTYGQSTPEITSFSSSAPSAKIGDYITLSWATRNGTAITASGDWSGPKNASGSEKIGPLTTEKVYSFTLTVADAKGFSTSKTVNVTVSAEPVPAPKITSFTASSADVNKGGKVTLTWTTQDAQTVTAGGDWSGTKALSGTEETGALQTVKTYSFILTATGKDGTSVSKTVKVVVSDLSVKNWEVGKAYTVGDIVLYNGAKYKCVIAHTSGPGWEPVYVPALWKKI